MFLRKRDDIGDEIATALDNFHPEPEPKIVQISEYYAGKLDDILAINRRDEADMQAQLDDLTERLRQIRLVIASLEPAQAALASDKP